jgi:hypothetical protein
MDRSGLEEIKLYKYVAYIACSVLLLWFIFGFILPYFMFYAPPANGGEFGDAFGSITSLFTGIGFIAISYTIMLQIQANRDQKKDQKFTLYNDLFNEIKNELYNLEWGTSKGVNCVNAIAQSIKQNSTRIENREIDHLLAHIGSTYEFLRIWIELIVYDRYLTKSQVHILQQKFDIMYLAYFALLDMALEKKDFDNPVFKVLKKVSRELKQDSEFADRYRKGFENLKKAAIRDLHSPQP